MSCSRLRGYGNIASKLLRVEYMFIYEQEIFKEVKTMMTIDNIKTLLRWARLVIEFIAVMAIIPLAIIVKRAMGE